MARLYPLTCNHMYNPRLFTLFSPENPSQLHYMSGRLLVGTMYGGWQGTCGELLQGIRPSNEQVSAERL